MAETFAKRTCKNCGIRKPANQLYTKKIINTYSGKSKRSVNGFTFFGMLLGDKGSARAISQWLFQSSNRKYGGSTPRIINLCANCYHRVGRKRGVFFYFFLPIIWPFLVIKFIFISPVMKELYAKFFSIIIWIIFKVLSVLRYIGIKIFDRNGDGKVDGKDFDIIFNKIMNLFTKNKPENINDEAKILND
jgi:hypothetical protein